MSGSVYYGHWVVYIIAGSVVLIDVISLRLDKWKELDVHPVCLKGHESFFPVA